MKFFEELADRTRSGILCKRLPSCCSLGPCHGRMFHVSMALMRKVRASHLFPMNVRGKSKGKVKGSNFSKLGVGRAQPGASPYVSITTWEVVMRKLRRADAERDITFAVRPDAVSTMQRSTVISCRHLGPEVFLLTMSQHCE